MIIKRIKLTNFKNFRQKEVFLSNMTFIKGKNGSGKTTLALESILFALWGYTPKESLKDLPTRNVAKSCSIEVEIHHNGKEYKIIRNYPTKLEVMESNKLLQFANNTEAQSYINRLFGDRIQFQKFRMVDAYTKETNFLEEGQTTLKRIIFSVSEDIFNNMRKNLTQLKHEREIFNKDGAVVYTHHPSEKRLQLISNKINELDIQIMELRKCIQDFESDYYTLERNIGKLEGEKEVVKSRRDKLLKNPECYACKQSIPENTQKRLLTETGELIQKVNNQIGKKLPEMTSVKEIIASHRKLIDKVSLRKNELKELKMKLEARIKQKDYKYTTKDVLIAKKAIEELDRLSTYYLTESIKILEPIINNILNKIGFGVKFEITEKGKFAIRLQKGDIVYKYKDLSTGEKLILQIAFKLALLLERGEEGIMVADEGMSSLDRENLLHVLSIFENMPFQLVFVIHNLEEVPENIKTINLNEPSVSGGLA